MGQRPAQIEQEIKDLRQEISARIENLTNRGATDVHDASEGVREGVHSLIERAGLASGMEERPYAYIAGAVAVGVALGMASESVSLPDFEFNGKTNKKAPQRNGKGGGFLGTIISGIEAAAVTEGQDLLRRWLTNDREDTPATERQGTPAR
jgi:hypothetical protein